MGQQEEVSRRLSRRHFLRTAALGAVFTVPTIHTIRQADAIPIRPQRPPKKKPPEGDHCHCCRSYQVFRGTKCHNNQWVDHYEARCSVCSEKCTDVYRPTGKKCYE